MNTRSILHVFYEMTRGRLYSLEEKERLFRLLTAVHEMEPSAVDRLWYAVRDLEEKEIHTVDDCEFCFFIACFTDSSGDQQSAIAALREVLLEQRSVVDYPNRSAWYRDVYSQNTPEKILERAMIEYVTGKTEESIQTLEKILSRTDRPVLEYLAVIAMEGGCYEKALEYAIRVQHVNLPGKREALKMEMPVFARIEEGARKQVRPERISAICLRAEAKQEGSFIGFTNGREV